MIFSILMILPFFIPNKIAVQYDWSFHASRAQQLYLNIRRGHLFTFLATDTFSKVGNANFLFYPSVFLYPWAILRLFLKPIEAYLIYVWLQMLATMIIAYFCMYKYSNKNCNASLIFAIIYTIVPYHLHLTLTDYVIGEGLAYMFIPIVLLGLYLLLTGQGWKTLSVGIALEFYCHIVDTVISIEICFAVFILWLLFNRTLNSKVFFDLLKSLLLFLLLTLWQIVPFITDYVHKGLAKPTFGIFQLLNPGDYIIQCLNNVPMSGNGGLGIILLMTVLFGWKWCRKGTADFYVYLIGLVLSLIITSLFPWKYLTHTPLAVIQFPYRYTSFAVCLLSVIAALGCIKCIQILKDHQMIAISIVVLSLFTVYAGESYPSVVRNNNSEHNIYVLKHSRKGKYRILSPKEKNPLVIIDNKTYNKQFSYGAQFGETDYLPLPSLSNANSVLNRRAYLNGARIPFSQSVSANKLNYKVNIPRNGRLDLPSVMYNRSTLTVNGQRTNIIESRRGTISVFLKKGKYQITVGYKPLIAYYLLLLVSVVTWISLLFEKCQMWLKNATDWSSKYNYGNDSRWLKQSVGSSLILW